MKTSEQLLACHTPCMPAVPGVLHADCGKALPAALPTDLDLWSVEARTLLLCSPASHAQPASGGVQELRESLQYPRTQDYIDERRGFCLWPRHHDCTCRPFPYILPIITYKISYIYPIITLFLSPIKYPILYL